jgi:type VI secretion system VasD/TssJ family lipoprotein
MNASCLLRALGVALLCFLAACGAKPEPFPAPAPSQDPAKVTWGMVKNGLSYRIVTAPDLNSDKGQALGLTLCVYQLKDSTQFQALAATLEGIDTLLDCKLEPAGAQAAKRFSLQPATELDIVSDRAEGARMLAVVAGYAHERPELCTATLPYPVSKGSEGIIFRTTVYSAAALDVVINLTESAVSLTGVSREQ